MPKDLACACAGVFSFEDADLSVDERCLVAARTLDVSGRAAGEVVYEFRLQLDYFIWVENVDVGTQPFFQDTSVFKTDYTCWSRSHAFDNLTHRVVTGFTLPIGQHKA